MQQAVAARIEPVDLRVEGATEALNIDRREPELSWRLDGTGREVAQTAYRVLVATEEDPLSAAETTWDSGEIASDRAQVAYAGPALAARTRYLWRVRVADQEGRWSRWSEPAAWEMGLLEASDWHGRWIGARRSQAESAWLENVARIWVGRRASDTARLRTSFDVPRGKRVLAARLAVAGPSRLWARINGLPVEARGTEGTLDADVAFLVEPGVNVLAVDALAPADDAPGVAARLEVSLEGTPPVEVVTSARWQAAEAKEDDFPPTPTLSHEGGGGSESGEDRDWSGWPRAAVTGLYSDPPWGRTALTERPSPYLRRAFQLTDHARRARLYVSALGVYELHVNGHRVGADHLNPGWTDYDRRVPYHCYDVTDLLRAGDNVLGAVLGEGWYAGSVGWFARSIYGRRPLLMAELQVELEDGSRTRVVSDAGWRVGEGGVRFTDLQMGEVQDGRLEPSGWSEPGFDDASWNPAHEHRARAGVLVAAIAPPIRVHHELHPASIREAGGGRWLVDFGQNLVGWVRLRVAGAAGTTVILRHTEVLTAGGNLYTDNLRQARQTDQYTLRGDPDGEVFEPRFTVHGFRHLEVSGYPGRLSTDAVVARVAYAAMETAGDFECSNADLNRLQRNIVWGQRGNFLSVPTDCPQRDERLGWTGDAQVFAATAAYNADVRGFFRKWLRDLQDAQLPDGSVPHVVPDVLTTFFAGHPSVGASGAAGWGDAVTIVPSVLYRVYGDARVVEELLPSMERWLGYLEAQSPGGVRPAGGFGDWLSIGADTPKDLIGTAFFAHSARLGAELARALGRTQNADRWQGLFERVRGAFRRAFVEGDARLAGDTQTAYVLALQFGLLEPDEVPRAAARLVSLLDERSWHLSTGFLGTPYLLDALTGTGHLDVAYRLLLQDTFPSWLYPVVHGDATTIWERWDGWSDHRGFQDAGMNSFNHYAYGCVGDWLYRTVAGIEAAEPGYRRIRVRPRPGGGLDWARGSLRTVHGPVVVHWRQSGDAFALDVTVPPNTRCEVHIPARDPGSVLEGGLPVASVDGVRPVNGDGGVAVFDVGSGTYRFQSELPPA